MKVKCIENRYGAIPEFVYEGLYGYTSESEALMNIGEVSTVYAITTIKKNAWYLVYFDCFAYPYFLPNQFFEIIDGRLSKFWQVKETLDSDDNNNRVIRIAVKEMHDNPYFLGELYEDYPEPTSIFRKIKDLMDNEFGPVS